MSELSQQAEKIYQSQILPHLPTAQLMGKIIAIEAESGEYFIDHTVLKAVMQGRQKYPQRPFFVNELVVGRFIRIRDLSRLTPRHLYDDGLYQREFGTFFGGHIY